MGSFPLPSSGEARPDSTNAIRTKNRCGVFSQVAGTMEGGSTSPRTLIELADEACLRGARGRLDYPSV
jgi:hypothetical protein